MGYFKFYCARQGASFLLPVDFVIIFTSVFVQ